jgi:hypothetical protein
LTAGIESAPIGAISIPDLKDPVLNAPMAAELATKHRYVGKSGVEMVTSDTEIVEMVVTDRKLPQATGRA